MKLGCVFLLSGLWAGAVFGGDWRSFLGPHQQPRNDEVNLELDWTAEGPPLLWKRVGGSSYSMPVVAGDWVIWFHRVGNEERVEGVSLATGETQWVHAYPSAYVDRYGYNNGPRAAPLIDNDRVYTFGAEGQFTCLALETGKLIWQRHLNNEFRVPQHFFGVGQAPVLHNRVLLLNVGADAATSFASGMAAISNVLATFLKPGDRIVSIKDSYGGTNKIFNDFLPPLNIDVCLCETIDYDQIEAEIAAGCKLLYLETPTNPTIKIIDIERLAAAAKRVGALVVVDNTFATPINQNPLQLGADIVLHSASKYLGGHADALGGVICGSRELVKKVSTTAKSMALRCRRWMRTASFVA